jgi:hypothetical protein
MRYGSALTAAVVALCAGAASATPPAAAEREVACAAHDEMVATLRERYGERRVAAGIENAGHMMEMFASPRTGSWTILATDPDGTACVMAVGEHFERRAPHPSEETVRHGTSEPRG